MPTTRHSTLALIEHHLERATRLLADLTATATTTGIRSVLVAEILPGDIVTANGRPAWTVADVVANFGGTVRLVPAETIEGAYGRTYQADEALTVQTIDCGSCDDGWGYMVGGDRVQCDICSGRGWVTLGQADHGGAGYWVDRLRREAARTDTDEVTG